MIALVLIDYKTMT